MGLFGNKTAAWEEWVGDNLDSLLMYAKWQTRSEADAQDVLQQVLQETWKDFKAQGPEEIYALVCRKVRLRAIDYYRSMDRRAEREMKYGELRVVQHESAMDRSWFDCPVEAQEVQGHLMQGLRALSEELQEVVVLHIWSERTFREIAEIMDMPKSTVMDRYKKGIAQLKDQLAEKLVCNN